MAKIFKITAYIVDPNDHYKDGEDWFSKMINGTDCYCPVPIEHQDVNFEWNYNLPINLIGCKKEDCEKYFKQ